MLEYLLPLLTFGLGIVLFYFYNRIKLGGYQAIAQQILHNAEKEAAKYLHQAELTLKQQQLEQQNEFNKQLSIEKNKISVAEERLNQREDKLQQKIQNLEKRLSDLDRKEAQLREKENQCDATLSDLTATREQLLSELCKIAQLEKEAAKDYLHRQLKNELEQESAQLVRQMIQEAEEKADYAAKRLLTSAINRLAVPSVSEATVSTIALPSEDFKSRIIGREGRNIRALEQNTGVSILVDDTPGVLVLSGYDPIRLQIAKMALTELLNDGRIHPSKIEEAVAQAKENIVAYIKQAGEDAAARVGIYDLHPEIIQLLGKLKYRYSSGQNILEHCVEVSYLMGMIADDLGLDGRLARRIGLLHDMGKAVSHEMEGTHALIGHTLSLKYGETQEVANGIGCHHGEMDPITLEGSLCSTADAISGSRPGARVDNLKQYINRLTHLEEIARSFEGVQDAYVVQAGQELRVLVNPEAIHEDQLTLLGRTLSNRIEKELNNKRKIKITIIREKRVTAYAV